MERDSDDTLDGEAERMEVLKLKANKERWTQKIGELNDNLGAWDEIIRKIKEEEIKLDLGKIDINCFQSKMFFALSLKTWTWPSVCVLT